MPIVKKETPDSGTAAKSGRRTAGANTGKSNSENTMNAERTSLAFSEAVIVNPPSGLKSGQVYPFVDMASVSSGQRDVSASEIREFKGSGSKFKARDTLMARITPCLENGKIARYLPAGDEELGHGSTEFIVIRGRPGVTDNDYAYYLTASPEVRNFAISQMTGTSGRQRVPTEALSKLTVSLPPLPEQKRIAHILGTLDDKIELNRKMNATLEAMARALFKSWFVDFDPVRAKMEGRQPEGMDAETAALFPDELVESELGMMPKGWEVKSLDQIANFLNGLALQKYPPTEGDPTLPVIKIAQIRKGDSIGADRCNTSLAPQYVVHDGDVLFSWSGSLEVVLWCGGQGALNQHLFKVTSEEFPKWFYYLWTLHHLDDFRQTAADKATTMGHIQRKHLTEAKVVVPPKPMLEKMNRILSPIVERAIANRVEANLLSEIRDSLLPRLLANEPIRK